MPIPGRLLCVGALLVTVGCQIHRSSTYISDTAMDKAQSDLLSRQRSVILGLLLALAAAAWAILVWTHADSNMEDMTRGSLTFGPRAPLFLVIWVVMMVAMMLPTAAPMI